MDSSKAVLEQIFKICLIAVLLISFETSVAEDLNWVNFTSMKDVRQMRLINDTVFIVSSGGILAVEHFSEPGRRYTNLDGLGTNDIYDIIADADGQKWVAGFGRLIRFNGDDSRQYLFFDVDDNLFRLNCIADDGDYLWIGTDLGLVLFSKTVDDGQIQDSYQLFDGLNPAPEVYDVALEDDSIWIATSSGLAVADRTDPLLLKSPLNWTGFERGQYPELLTDTIINVAGYNGAMFVATRRGVYRLNTEADTSFVGIQIAGLSRVYQMKKENDSLFVYWLDTSGAYGVVDADSVIRFPTTGLTGNPVTGTADGNVRWSATSAGVFYSASGEFVEYPFTGMPGNDISDIAINSDGVLTAGFRNIAFARLGDSVWTKYSTTLAAGTTYLITDSSGYAWMGTAGAGVWVYNGDTLAHYNYLNSSLIGMSPWYEVVLGLATDGNYIYIGSYRPFNDHPIAIGDLSNLGSMAGWDSIGPGEGLTDDWVVDIDLHGGKLAVATQDNGVFVCNVGNDPFNANITCQQFTRENSLLISNSARHVEYSPDGELWVGTVFGLSRYDRGIDYFRDVDLPPEVGASVTALEFDSRGNLWVGTNEGLVVVDAVTGEKTVYNTLNSGIAGEQINSITYDPFTGDFYVGTASGFSYVRSRMGTPVSDVGQVVAFPNPFVISDDSDRLSFNFAGTGEVRIFDVAGELVRRTAVGVPWDGKNEAGETVSSGVYIFVITDAEGKVGKGKFLLVRQ